MNTKDNSFSFSVVSKDAKIQFQDLESFGFSKMLMSHDFRTVDTIHVASVKWKQTLSDSIVEIKDNQLKEWLKKQIKTDSIVLKND